MFELLPSNLESLWGQSSRMCAHWWASGVDVVRDVVLNWEILVGELCNHREFVQNCIKLWPRCFGSIEVLSDELEEITS